MTWFEKVFLRRNSNVTSPAKSCQKRANRRKKDKTIQKEFKVEDLGSGTVDASQFWELNEYTERTVAESNGGTTEWFTLFKAWKIK